jgi:DNA-binding beta-propeller fold protein YncE
MTSATIALTICLTVTFAAHGQENDPLRLVAKIPVPGMTGTWDHLAADPATKRLFLSAQDDNAVQVIDLATRKPLPAITGGFNRPQGLYYVSGVNALAVSNSRDGTLRSFDGNSFAPIKTIFLTLGADMMDYDPGTKYLYIDHGGVDSHRGPGGLAIIDVEKWEQVGNIATEYRPAALEIERVSQRLFVTLPGLSQVGVVDTKTRQIITRFQAPQPTKPVALALDTASHRAFVGTRAPDTFIAFDTETGKVVATLDSVGGIEGMYFDAANKRIYVTGLEGVVEAYQEVDADHYKSIAKIPIVPKAGTSLFIPQLNLFCVAAPPHDGQAAEIWLFEPQP